MLKLLATVAFALVVLGSARAAPYHAGLSYVAGAPTFCASAAEWRELGEAWGYEPGALGGLYFPDERVVRLAPHTCRALLATGEEPRSAVVEALHAVAHERQHVLGVLDEDQADCLGAMAMPWAARRLQLPVRHLRPAARHFFGGSPIPRRCWRWAQ